MVEQLQHSLPVSFHVALDDLSHCSLGAKSNRLWLSYEKTKPIYHSRASEITGCLSLRQFSTNNIFPQVLLLFYV